MNILYIDTRMGATSTKLFGALIDLIENPDLFIYNFNRIGIQGLLVHRLDDALNGVTGSRLEYRYTSSSEHDPYADEIDDDGGKHGHRHHVYRTLSDVVELIESLSIEKKIADRAIKIYKKIAETSAEANGQDIRIMKLRRTGSRDIIASIVGVCMALEELNADKIIASTISVGDGYVHTPRGRMPVPVPELQTLLGDAPYTAGTENGELCTLCGAALITEIADEYGSIPEMSISKSGAGFGRRVFRSGVNCVRTYIGRSMHTAATAEYIELTAQVYGTDKAEAASLATELSGIGAKSVCMLPSYGADGSDGFVVKMLVSDDNADNIATYMLENTNADQVIRVMVKAYTK